MKSAIKFDTKASRRKIHDAIAATNQAFVERTAVINHIFAALLGRHHVWIFGAPGTAKSALLRYVARVIVDASFFDLLLSKRTTDAALFGPYKVSALKQDTYERNTRGRLPEANIALLDEGGRADPSLHETLLRLANEREFENGDPTAPMRCPLISLFSGSNSILTDPELEAFVDRFLVTVTVEYIRDDAAFMDIIGRPAMPPVQDTLTLAELAACQAEVQAVRVSADFKALITKVKHLLRAAGITVSDRRWVQIVEGLKAFAWLDAETEIQDEHLEWAVDMLWRKPEERRAVMNVIGALANPLVAAAVTLSDRAHASLSQVPKDDNDGNFLNAASKANKMLKDIVAELDSLIRTNPERKTARLRQALSEINASKSNLVARVRAKSE